MPIATLSDFFNVGTAATTLSNATITVDSATNEAQVTGTTTVLGMENQSVSVSFSVADNKLVVKSQVTLLAVTLQQLAALGVLPVSAYPNTDLPAIAFTNLHVTADSRTRLLTFRGSGPSSLPLGIAALPLTGTSLYLEVSVAADTTVTNRQAFIAGTLPIGAGLPVQVMLPRGVIDWQLYGDTSVGLTHGLADLTALTGTAISSLLPGTMPGLQSFALSSILVQFNPLTAYIASVQCTVSSTDIWNVIAEVLQVTGFELNLSFTRWDSSVNSAMMVGGSIEGTLQIFDVPVSISLPLPPGASTWYLTTYPNITIPGIGDLVANLSNLIGTGDLSTSFPPGLDTLGSLLVTYIEIGFSPTQQTAAQILESITFRLQTATDWVLPYANSIKLSNGFLDLSIAYPLATENERVVTGALGGTIYIGSVSIPVLIERPTAAANWVMRIIYSDIAVGLPDLLTLTGVNATDFRAALPPSLSIVNDLALTALEVDYDLTANALAYASFIIGLTDSWTIIPSYLVVQDIELSAEYVQFLDDNTWQFLLYLSAAIEITTVTILLSATNAGPAGAWTLTGAMNVGDTLQLNSLITWLLQQLLAADFHLPSGFPEVTATGAEVRITPATGAFYAKLISQIAWNIAFAQATFKVNNLTTILDIGALPTPAPPAQAVRPYTFTASGDFQWNTITGAATFVTSSGSTPTVIQVEVTANTQLSLSNMVNGLLDSGSGGGTTAWDSVPVPADYSKPDFMIQAGLLINLTDKRFLAHGSFILPGGGANADMYGAVVVLVAQQGTPPQYYYAVALALKNWRFASISSVLGSIESVLSVKQTNAVLLLSQFDALDIGSMAIYLPVPGTGIGTKRGLNFSAELEFTSGLLAQVAQLLGVTTQGPFTINGYIPTDASQSEFRATLGSLTLLGFLSFRQITLLYRAQQTSTFTLQGQIVVHIDKDYTFDGDVTVITTTENNLAVTRATAHIVSAQAAIQPLGIPHLNFSNLFFELYYVFGGGQVDTQFLLGGSVAFTSAVSLSGLIYFKQASPVVTVIEVSTLAIDDLFAAVIGSSWPTGLLDISFHHGMLYYAPNDVTLVRFDPATNTTETLHFQAGFRAATDIDIFFIKNFHIEATILSQGIIITGGYQTPIDWGFIKLYRGPSVNPVLPSDPTMGPLVSVNSMTSTFTLSGGFALFDTPLASLLITVQRQMMAGHLQIDQSVGPFGRPSFDFVWDENGFRVTNWPLGHVKLPDFDFENIPASGSCPLSGILKIPITSEVTITPSFSITLEVVPPSTDKKPFLNITLAGSLDLVIVSSAYPDALLSAPIGNAQLRVPFPGTGAFTWDMLANSFIDCLKSAASSIFDTLIKDPRNLAKLLAVKGIEWGVQAVKDFLICEGASAAEAAAFVEAAGAAVPVTVGILGVAGIVVGGVIAFKDNQGNQHNEGGGGGASTPRPDAPSAPTLTYANGVLTVHWSQAVNANKYIAVLKQDGNAFAQSNPIDGFSTTFTVPDGHSYSALIVATGDGGTSDPGASATLTVLGHITNSSVTYADGNVVASWEQAAAVSGATQYVGQLLDSNQRPFGTTKTVDAQTGGTPTLRLEIALPLDAVPVGTISMQVQAITNVAHATAGNWSVSSDTVTKLAPPVITALTYDSGQVTATLQAGITNANAYIAQFVNPANNTGVGAESSTSAATPAVARLDDSGVSAGTYKVRVQAAGVGNKLIPSDWSISTTTIVTLGAVSLSSLTYASNQVEASWSASATASGYAFELRGGAAPIAGSVQAQQGQPAPTHLSLPIGATIPRGIQYSGYVRATFDGKAGAWSQGVPIILLDIPAGVTATYTLDQISVTWSTVTGATAYDLELLASSQQPALTVPRVAATVAPTQQSNINVAQLTEGAYTVQVRAVADTLMTAWSNPISVTIDRLTPERLAEQLHQQQVSAQDAARQIVNRFSSQFTNHAALLIPLLRTHFPESTKTLTQVAWALAMVPYPVLQSATAIQAVYQASVSIADSAAALKAAYPAPGVQQQVSQLVTSGSTAAVAAPAVHTAHADLTALQMAVLLRMNFAATVSNPTQMAEALNGCNYAALEATAAVSQVYPLSSVADIAAAINQVYVRR